MHLNITDGMWNWYFILPPGRPGLARPRYRMYIKFFDQDNVANKFFFYLRTLSEMLAPPVRCETLRRIFGRLTQPIQAQCHANTEMGL